MAAQHSAPLFWQEPQFLFWTIASTLVVAVSVGLSIKVAKEREFYSSQASQILARGILTKMAEGQITLCTKQSSHRWLISSCSRRSWLSLFPTLPASFSAVSWFCDWPHPLHTFPCFKSARVCFCCLQPKTAAWSRAELWDDRPPAARLEPFSVKVSWGE